MITGEMITGTTEVHLEAVAPTGGPLHESLRDSWSALQRLAARQGFDLQLASGFRSFERQLSIWNAKARGERPVYDSLGRPMEIDRLSERELVFAILRWSALPGASRHHWGSDIDIFDAAAVPPGYRLQLTLDECRGAGPFARLHQWLDTVLDDSGMSQGFFRPYKRDRGGVAPEPWHLSFAPVASAFQKRFDVQYLRQLISVTEICLKQTVLDHLDEIFQRFIVVPWEAYPENYRNPT